jgi:hypothetical protein
VVSKGCWLSGRCEGRTSPIEMGECARAAVYRSQPLGALPPYPPNTGALPRSSTLLGNFTSGNLTIAVIGERFSSGDTPSKDGILGRCAPSGEVHYWTRMGPLAGSGLGFPRTPVGLVSALTPTPWTFFDSSFLLQAECPARASCCQSLSGRETYDFASPWSNPRC